MPLAVKLLFASFHLNLLNFIPFDCLATFIWSERLVRLSEKHLFYLLELDSLIA